MPEHMIVDGTILDVPADLTAALRMRNAWKRQADSWEPGSREQEHCNKIAKAVEQHMIDKYRYGLEG